jgi:hypothetical protein
MQNLPNITPLEVGVLCAAVLVLYFAPAVLTWSDARRRRKAQVPVQESPVHAEQTTLASAPLEPSPREVGAVAPSAESPAVPLAMLGSGECSAEAVGNPAAAELTPQSAVGSLDESAVSAAFPSAVHTPAATLDRNDGAPLELQPLSGPARHRFRLADLHQTQLPDWPPAAIRSDADRYQAWQEAERVAEQYQATIASASIWSPYPARSSCLGAAEAVGPCARVHFLLFPVPWPVTQNQAVAQAVFEIDPSRGAVRGWVDALRESELTDDNRREIRASGGVA